MELKKFLKSKKISITQLADLLNIKKTNGLLTNKILGNWRAALFENNKKME